MLGSREYLDGRDVLGAAGGRTAVSGTTWGAAGESNVIDARENDGREMGTDVGPFPRWSGTVATLFRCIGLLSPAAPAAPRFSTSSSVAPATLFRGLSSPFPSVGTSFRFCFNARLGDRSVGEGGS